jgi:hypothetical protein
MSTKTNTSIETTAKVSAHSPCTLSVAACRLAAIAAIADTDSPIVANAYARQAEDHAKTAAEVAADDNKDRRQVKIAQRWVKAAMAVAGSVK